MCGNGATECEMSSASGLVGLTGPWKTPPLPLSPEGSAQYGLGQAGRVVRCNAGHILDGGKDGMVVVVVAITRPGGISLWKLSAGGQG